MLCPVCSSQSYKCRYIFSWGRVVQCLLCSSAYGDGYDVEEMNRITFNNPNLDVSIDLCRLWAKERLATLKKYIISGRLLEFGAGTGEFLYTAAQAGFYSVGLDIFSRLRKENYHPMLSIITADVRYFRADVPFDVVAALHLLEHFSKPYEFLTSIRENLKKNGYLLVEVPNFASLSRFVLKRHETCFVPYHYLYLTPKSLVTLLENAGFKILELQSVGSSTTQVIGRVGSFILRHLGFKNLSVWWEPSGLLKESVINLERLFFWGLNLRVVARKV